MKNYTEYIIAEEVTTDKLAKTVQKLMNEGWQPTGGIAIEASSSHYNAFMQALVR